MSRALIDFIRGPMFWIAAAVFVCGLSFQAWRFFRLTRDKPRRFTDAPAQSKKSRAERFLQRLGQLWLGCRRSLLGRQPTLVVVTVVFHCLLFVIPLFLWAHNRRLKDALGVSLGSLPEALTHFLTGVFLLCCAFFLLRRILVRQVRALTAGTDLLTLGITAAPFLTGYLAYLQWFDYKTILLLHMVSGELMLVLVPFTKLGHMLFFFFYRFFFGDEYSFGQGSRTW